MDIAKIAQLADLTLSVEEEKELEPQLVEIVGFFDQLNEVNTDDVKPTSQTTGLIDVTRHDEVNATRVLPVSRAVSNAHKEINNYFVVDAILDKES